MLQNYIVLDLEMTGLSPRKDCILEIGAVKIENKQIVDTFSVLLSPDCELEERITNLTGITQEMIRDGESPEMAIPRFLDFAGDLVWVGHHIQTDYSFLRQWTYEHNRNLKVSAVDTLEIARKMLPQLPHKTLDFLCDEFGIVRQQNHRALEDAKATYVLYEKLEREFLEREPSVFLEKELSYKPKKEVPATQAQKKYLKELAEYHRISLELSMEGLLRSEASRMTDKIIAEYGRPQVSWKHTDKKHHRPT